MALKSVEDTWSATAYNTTASFVYSPTYTSKVLSWLDAKRGERIIDFGCGTGEVTRRIASSVGESGCVVGIDSSESMIQKAKTNETIQYFVADIQNDIAVPEVSRGSFDAVFSNATLHWCKRDPMGVIRNARECLKPRGKFVAELGGFSNVIGVRSALHKVLKARGYDPITLDPWFFPSVAHYSRLLTEGGFHIEQIELEPRLTPLTSTLSDWVRLFCRDSWLKDMDDEEAEGIINEVQDICQADAQDDEGNWFVMYCRLRFKAVKS